MVSSPILLGIFFLWLKFISRTCKLWIGNKSKTLVRDERFRTHSYDSVKKSFQMHILSFQIALEIYVTAMFRNTRLTSKTLSKPQYKKLLDALETAILSGEVYTPPDNLLKELLVRIVTKHYDISTVLAWIREQAQRILELFVRDPRRGEGWNKNMDLQEFLGQRISAMST